MRHLVRLFAVRAAFVFSALACLTVLAAHLDGSDYRLRDIFAAVLFMMVFLFAELVSGIVHKLFDD